MILISLEEMTEKNTQSPSLDELLEGNISDEFLTSPENGEFLERKEKSNDTFNSSPLSSLDDLLHEISSPLQKSDEKIKKNDEKISSSIKEEMSLDELLSSKKNSGEEHSPSLHFIDKNQQKNIENNLDKKEGNIFHQTFNEDTLEDSELLKNIENYGEGNKFELNNTQEIPEKRKEDPFILMKKKEEDFFHKKEYKFRQILMITQSFVVFSLLFILSSVAIFSFLLDTPSKGLLGGIIKNNYGINLEEKIAKYTALQAEEIKLKKDITKNEKIIAGFENNEVLESIISERINWIEIIREINGVRCYADPDGDINECMKDSLSDSTAFNPFSFENYTTKGDMTNGKIEIMISGKVHGSQGYIFQKISRLIDAFNESKYFDGAEMRRFSKSQDSRLGYFMPFTMKLIYYKNGKTIKDSKTDEIKTE